MGWVALAILALALVTRLKVWVAWHFVLLIYAVVALALGSAVSGWVVGRGAFEPFGGSPLAVAVKFARWPLWVISIFGLMYLESASVRGLVGWFQRQLYLLQFH